MRQGILPSANYDIISADVLVSLGCETSKEGRKRNIDVQNFKIVILQVQNSGNSPSVEAKLATSENLLIMNLN